MLDCFGMNIALKHRSPEQLDKYVELIKELNAGWVRIEFDYYQNPQEYYPMADYLTKKLHENDIKIVGVLAGVVPGTLLNLINSGIKFNNPLDELDKFKSYVKDLCERYKGEIHHWQIWNEENIRRFWTKKAKPEEYFKLFTEVYPIIKDINPDNKVMMGSTCGDDVDFLFFGFEINFLKRLIEMGINDYIDIYNFHPYITSNYVGFASKDTLYRRMKKRIDTYYNAYNHYGKEIWITEMGISKYTVLHAKRRDEDIGENYVKLMDHSISKGIKIFLWVLTDFNDKYYSFFNPEQYFGLVDYELNKKPIFHIVKNYTDKLLSDKS